MSQITLEKDILLQYGLDKREKPRGESSKKCTVCDRTERTHNMH